MDNIINIDLTNDIDDDSSSLKTMKMSNRKRPRSPDTRNNNDKSERIKSPPNKKQKTSLKPKSSRKKKMQKKKKLKQSFAESKDEEINDDDDNEYQTKIKTVIRIKDIERFEDDQYDDDNDYDDIDKSRKLKFTLLINEKNNNKNVYCNLSEIFRTFKYSSTSTPNLLKVRQSFIKYCSNKYNSSIIKLYIKFNKKYYISESGFCVLIESLIKNKSYHNNKYIQHFCYFRYYYRKNLFLNNNLSKYVKRIKQPKSIDNIQICQACYLEDVEENYIYENPCDCDIPLHINDCKLFPQLTRDSIPNYKDKNHDWFCPFCVRYLSTEELKERRRQYLSSNDGDGGSFEVEKVIDYDWNDNKYLVKWRNYPFEANSWEELSSSFIEAVEQFWKDKNTKIPDKAQKDINDEKKNMMDIGNELGKLDIDIDDDDDDEGEEEEDDDVDMKSDQDKDENGDRNKNKNDNNDNKLFIESKLSDVMDEKFIIRRQKYTTQTFTKRKEIRNKYKKWLQNQVIKGTKIGNEVKYEMNNNLLPKWHLRSINEDWDCGLPRIRDIIISFLSRNWKEWKYDLSHKSIVLGEIIDPENPAKKYGEDQGVHSHKAYGLFSINKIKKDELLFEYAGCVKPIGQASKKLDHLESELSQTTLFDLIGHLDTQNRNKLHWGKKPNQQLVIDPSKWHNEGVYMNDYRDNVMDDPDDDIEQTQDGVTPSVINNNNNNNNKRKQNVKFYEVLVNGWPRVFAVALCDIQPNEELLGDYGVDFWANFRLMMRRQQQLNEIKQRINDQWQTKLNNAQNIIKQQKKEIEQLKKQLLNK